MSRDIVVVRALELHILSHHDDRLLYSVPASVLTSLDEINAGARVNEEGRPRIESDVEVAMPEQVYVRIVHSKPSGWHVVDGPFVPRMPAHAVAVSVHPWLGNLNDGATSLVAVHPQEQLYVICFEPQCLADLQLSCLAGHCEPALMYLVSTGIDGQMCEAVSVALQKLHQGCALTEVPEPLLQYMQGAGFTILEDQGTKVRLSVAGMEQIRFAWPMGRWWGRNHLHSAWQ